MNIHEIAKLLKATTHHVPEGSDIDITHAGASDLMSDVLAYVAQDILLITGLQGPQVIRTAALLDISAVLFTRGKTPTSEIIEEAKKSNIAILSTALKTYTSCGLLFCAGIRSIDEDAYQKDNHVS